MVLKLRPALQLVELLFELLVTKNIMEWFFDSGLVNLTRIKLGNCKKQCIKNLCTCTLKIY
jgi:hypothetical protein